MTSQSHPRSLGFTLLEMMTVVALIAITTGLAIGGIEFMTKRGSFTVAAGTVLGSLRSTQAEATGRGNYTAFVIDTNGGQYWGFETDAGFDVSTFSPSGLGTVIVSGSLPSGSSFNDGGYGAALPPPFDFTPVTTGNLLYCSFCLANGFGSILFQPGGAATFSGGVDGGFQQFTLTGVYGKGRRVILVAIMGKTGDVETFEQ
jgi:prepilin-type N-terminal cleavage/methylation domain-containing protein